MLFRLLLLSTLLTACNAKSAYELGAIARQSECSDVTNTPASEIEQQRLRCKDTANLPYDAYQKQSQ